MAHLDLQRTTYAAAETLLNGRDSRRIGHNTRLHRVGGALAVEYHSTDILTLTPDGLLVINTGGWETVTTLSRLNYLLPGPYRLGSRRFKRNGRSYSTLWLYAGGYPVTPYADGLTLRPDDGAILFAGDVILTAEDVATIRTLAEVASAERERKRIARNAAQHAARPDAPSDAFRHGWYCDACRAIRKREHAAYVAELGAAHDRGEHVREQVDYTWPIDPATGRPDYSQRAVPSAPRMVPSCPWMCPQRNA